MQFPVLEYFIKDWKFTTIIVNISKGSVSKGIKDFF